MKEIKKILIIRTDKIGDIILTLPLAKVIKDNFPNAEIDFLVQNYTAPIVKLNKYISNIIILPNSFKELFSFLQNAKYDIAITVKPEFNIAFALFLAKVPIRIGTAYRFYSFFFNKKIYHHRKKAEKNELEYNFDLIRPLNINFQPNFHNVDFGFEIPDEITNKVKKILNDYNIDFTKKILIVHPGSGKSSADYPINKLKFIIDNLSKLNINIIVTGNHTEQYICDYISQNKVANLAGKLKLDELAALINLSDFLIANSTGPIHIAAALNKWSIGFYPLVKECSETRWGPYTSKKIIFTPSNTNCKHLKLSDCIKNQCMNSIDPENVFNTISKLIKSE